MSEEYCHTISDQYRCHKCCGIDIRRLSAKLEIAIKAMEQFKTTFLDKYHPGENWFPETLVIGEALEKLKK